MNNSTTPILAIHNRHADSCGKPPALETGDGKYYGYFASSTGDQWIFTYDPANQSAILVGGDTNWERVYPVVNGEVSNLVLEPSEIAWLQACWAAATTFVHS